jgi:hypothetical protein
VARARADDRGVAGLLRTAWRRVIAFIDDALPMTPGEREERDSAGQDPEELSNRRQRRIRIRLLEKRGKGGYR